MKTKSFKSYLERRLNRDEITEIKKQAQLEVRILRSLQGLVSKTVDDYTKQHKIGFNELVRILGSSPSQVVKIRQGKANLTLSSLAHLLALMGKDPGDLFKGKSKG